MLRPFRPVSASMRNPAGILFGDLREVLRLRGMGRGEEKGDAPELTG